MKYIFLLTLFFCVNETFAKNSNINNFIVKESLLKNSKLAIIAADSLNNPIETINGIYTLPLTIAKSTFVYIKHQNDKGTHGKLLYVYKKEGDLNPFTISRIFLIIVPLIIVILAFAFKKFIYIAVILLLIFMYFNHSNGLNISTFFETTFDYLKNLV